MAKVEAEAAEEVKDEEEWVAADWVPVGNADAPSVDIQCRIKRACHAISRRARNAGLKWHGRKRIWEVIRKNGWLWKANDVLSHGFARLDEVWVLSRLGR